MVSFRGQKKIEPRQDRSPLGSLIQNLRRAYPSLSYAEFPPRAAEKTITLDFSTPTRLINRPCRVTPELSSSYPQNNSIELLFYLMILKVLQLYNA